MSDPLFQALIESNRRLTDTFENKANEIDHKVEQTANEIAETITSNNLVTYYVDAENGNDENTGASSRPFKTLKKALRTCSTGSKATIYVARSQRHILDGENVRCYAAFVNIVPWKDNTDTSQSYHYDETTPIVSLEAVLYMYGTIVFGSYRKTLIVETSEKTPTYGIQFSTAGNFVIARSRLILNLQSDSIPLCGSYFNYVNPVKVALREADIVKTKGFLARSGCLFSVDVATGFQYTDDVILGADENNTPSNVPFTPQE
ncbi:hypothetical protein CAG67_15840 [Vibrio sp. V41_P2S12T139]|uniref:hypothetical protein n=1 Tax=Vibrio sp. V42_P2S4T144 TaxID=1938693 RepID=UPI001373373B|nr:hypothetical protein [Vibrio sp. V41_P2S12T139]NAW93387.1 hypothetical protein [Vibrio sp. V42_P2S4T144]